MREFLMTVCFLPLFLTACGVGGSQSDKERRAQALQRGEAAAWHDIQAKRIREIGTRLTKTAPDGEALAFYVLVGGGRIDPSSINAFTDGKNVFVTEGMVRFVKSTDELAFVLAHEVAHIRRGHLTDTQGRYVLTGILAVPAVIFAGPLAGHVLHQLLFASTRTFDRDQEREADLYALIWLNKAGFNAESGSEIFKRLGEEKPETLESGFFSSHPTSTERFERIQKVVDVLKKGLDPLQVLAVSIKESAPAIEEQAVKPLAD
jgi:predicted Zn-dependent protease